MAISAASFPVMNPSMQDATDRSTRHVASHARPQGSIAFQHRLPASSSSIVFQHRLGTLSSSLTVADGGLLGVRSLCRDVAKVQLTLLEFHGR
jgi:hypothetical protein